MRTSKKIRISAPAQKDLKRIGEYTLREWGVLQRRKYLGQLGDGFKLIGATPSLGAPWDDIDTGLRAYPVGRDIIFYIETVSELVIVRVLHDSMDPKRHLGSI